MRLIQIAVASADPTVGAVRSNVDRMLSMAREMASADVTLACYSEQVVGGYPPEDLIQWRAFVDRQRIELERFARETADLRTVFVAGVAVAVSGQIFNAAAVVHGGAVLGFVPKEKLPTYNVFYEARTFSRGRDGLALDAAGVPLGDYLFAFDFGTIAVEVCEDAWSPDGPMRRRSYSGAEVVVNVSASPYRMGVVSTRREMLSTRSADSEVTLVYGNTVGAQDGLIFDGGGYVFQNGRRALDAPRFREGWAACVVDLDRTRRMRQENTTWRTDLEAFQARHPPIPVIRSEGKTADRSRLRYPPPLGDSFFLPAPGAPTGDPRDEVLDDLISALSIGIRDYYRKTGAFRCIGVALSGGRDSMLTLLIAWRAALLLGGEVGETVQAFYMPTRFSGEGTRGAAARLCEELGIPLRVVPIEEAFDREVEAARAMLGGAEPTAVTLQNIQARLRSARMWNWANSAGGLFLQTGDMSEKAVGYTTIGGDLEGALSVIANIPKTVVIALLERFHRLHGFEGVAQT
ncbi:MAG: NAD(+) synthase, partial [Acidobacteriota bacterium]